MTVAQAGELELQPSRMFRLVFAKAPPGDGYGLSPAGGRIWFVGNDFDKKTLAEFTQRVKTICAVDFVGATIKASDGQPIRLTFRPVMRNRHGELILTQIERALPPNLSESQIGEMVNQAKARYGESFSREYLLFPKKATVSIRRDFATGTSLSLVLPFEKIRNALKEQPGCSDKAQLD
jgi:hypothetical protein